MDWTLFWQGMFAGCLGAVRLYGDAIGFIIVVILWLVVSILMERAFAMDGWDLPDWMILPVAFLLLSACTPAHAAPLDMDLLRDTICEKESRYMTLPYVGDGGDSHGDCQLSNGTAHWIIPYAVERKMVPYYMLELRAHKSVLESVLHVPFVNRGLALAYLHRIARMKRTHDPERIAYHYNGGHNSDFGAKPDAMAYAREVVILMKGPPRKPGDKNLDDAALMGPGRLVVRAKCDLLGFGSTGAVGCAAIFGRGSERHDCLSNAIVRGRSTSQSRGVIHSPYGFVSDVSECAFSTTRRIDLSHRPRRTER